jgi:radical SAM superfamily enzyme YgiQ (UPF0313 family)
MTDDQVQLLGASGVSHIGFGTETASPEILSRMDKHHQTVSDMYEAAAKCARAGIRVTFNLIFGFPGEEDRHCCETMRVMGDNFSTPYPGIPIWSKLREMGMPEPETLAGWARIDLGANNLPWLQGSSFRKLERGIRYFLLDNEINRSQRKVRRQTFQSLLRLIRKSLHWRLKHAFFEFPLEL